MSKEIKAPDKEAAKSLILKILAVAGGELEAENRLHKAFYAAHLIYWKTQEGFLTDYPIVKLENGPGVDGLRRLLAELHKEEKVDIEYGEKGPYPQTTVRLKAPIQVDPTSVEFQAIKRAVNWVKRHDTRYLSDKTHERPSYGQPRIGHEQAIYLDLLSSDDYTAVRVLSDQVDEAFRAAFAKDN